MDGSVVVVSIVRTYPHITAHYIIVWYESTKTTCVHIDIAQHCGYDFGPTKPVYVIFALTFFSFYCAFAHHEKMHQFHPSIFGVLV